MYEYFAYIAIVLNFALAIFVYTKNPKKRTNWLFGIVLLLAAFWQISKLIEKSALDANTAFIAERLIWTSVIFLVAVFLDFAKELIGRKEYTGFYRSLVYVMAICLVIILWTSKVFILHSEIRKGSFTEVYNFGAFALFVYVFLLWLYAMINLITAYLNVKGILKRKLRYVVIGTSIPVISLITDGLFPMMGYVILPTIVGSLTMSLMAVIITYSFVLK